MNVFELIIAALSSRLNDNHENVVMNQLTRLAAKNTQTITVSDYQGLISCLKDCEGALS